MSAVPAVPNRGVKLWDDYWGVPLSTEYTARPEKVSAVEASSCRPVSTSDQPDPINVEAGDLLPGAPFMQPILAKCSFLVRAEYVRMYEYVEASFATDTELPPAVVITGQPGIGMIICLNGLVLVFRRSH